MMIVPIGFTIYKTVYKYRSVFLFCLRFEAVKILHFPTLRIVFGCKLDPVDPT